MCRADLPDGHLWLSMTIANSLNRECDYCISCGLPRPGFVDPAVKAEKWKEYAAEEEGTPLQGLPGGGEAASPLPGAAVCDAPS